MEAALLRMLSLLRRTDLFHNNSTIIVNMSNSHWSYNNPDRFSTAPVISSTSARSSEPEIPPEPAIPGSNFPDAGIHPARFLPTPLVFPQLFLRYADMNLPQKGGYPRTREGLSLLLRIFRRHQHPPIGLSRGHRNVPHKSDHRHISTPDSSGLRGLPNRTPVRSGTSKMSHFSLGYTKVRRSCASPDYHWYPLSNFP